MVFTLQRYIFRELLKIFVLAAVALTLILSLGSVLRPIQQYGVGPRQVLHLMVYFLPITLTFVLPMAALLASALVYGRFASDNELDACKASGISLVTLVYPGLALALMVAIANLLLSFHMMPAFVHLAEKCLKADAKQILFRNIQRKGYYMLPPDDKYLIYADQVNNQNDTLSGVIIAKLKENKISEITTTEHARVNFIPHEKVNEVYITAVNTYQMDADGSLFLGLSSLTAEFGSLLGDEIKFKKIREMKKIRDIDPMLFYPIEKLAREVYAQLTVELLAQEINSKISEDANSFCELLGEPNSVKFTAGECRARGEEEVELLAEVVLTEYDTGSKKNLHTLRSSKALLRIEGDKQAPTLTMDIYNAREEGTEELKFRHIIRGLLLPPAVEEATSQFKNTERGSLKAEELASELPVLYKKPSGRLTELQGQLETMLKQTLAEIEAEIHSRLVFGIGCVPMILIGIGLGILLKGGHLLSAFGASCVPAAVLIVCIMMGKNIAKNLDSQDISGVMLMWAGLAFLVVLALVTYRRLLKN